MATLFDGRQGDWGFTGGGYVIGYKGALYYDSITRSGNTVTISNLRCTGWFTSDAPYGMINRGYMTYTSTFTYTIVVTAGSGNISSSHSIGPGTYYSGNVFPNCNNKGLGNLSFSVGASDTSATVTFKLASDTPMSTTISFPAGTKKIKATAENATFDIKKAGTSVGNDVSSYEATWDYNTKYDISDIKAKSGYYIYEQTSDTSGNLTSDKTWTIAKAKKYITFKVTGTNVTFDVKLNNSVVANDKQSYTNTTTKQGWSYSVSDIKRLSSAYILDSTNPKSGTTSSSNITINAGVASSISLASSITYKSPIKVTSKCDITIDDKSGRTRNWYFVAKLKQGNTVLATLNKTTGTTKSATLTFDRNTTSTALKSDTTYTVEWTVSDKTDTFGQTFTKTSTFSLPCLGYVVTGSSKKKISYFTITDATDAPTHGKINYSFKRITKT